MKVQIVAAALALAALPAAAHQAPSGWFYPFECCAGFDCAAVPSEAVSITAQGYRVTLRPGEHPMIRDREWTDTIPYGEAKPSPDGEFHICIRPATHAKAPLSRICFWAPPPGS